jgi:hypothetical protein
MADKKISQLTAATTPLNGTEVLPIVNGGEHGDAYFRRQHKQPWQRHPVRVG